MKRSNVLNVYEGYVDSIIAVPHTQVSGQGPCYDLHEGGMGRTLLEGRVDWATAVICMRYEWIGSLLLYVRVSSIQRATAFYLYEE